MGSVGEDSPDTRRHRRLAEAPSTYYEIVLTNPPFGKKSSITVVNEEGEETKEALTYYRDDFWATTSNKQLNFLQHVKSLLKIHGRAAIVVPDNVLFEGGAGETIRRNCCSMRCAHPAATADGNFLRPRRESERPLFRPQTCQRETVD